MPRNRDRHCCDGRCVYGQGCPAFAPGAIDGPHRRLDRTWWRPAGVLLVMVLAAAAAWWGGA